jgi:hypothetical protein
MLSPKVNQAILAATANMAEATYLAHPPLATVLAPVTDLSDIRSSLAIPLLGSLNAPMPEQRKTVVAKMGSGGNRKTTRDYTRHKKPKLLRFRP